MTNDMFVIISAFYNSFVTAHNLKCDGIFYDILMISISFCEAYFTV